MKSDKEFYDMLYDVWRYGGNPDAMDEQIFEDNLCQNKTEEKMKIKEVLERLEKAFPEYEVGSIVRATAQDEPLHKGRRAWNIGIVENRESKQKGEDGYDS